MGSTLTEVLTATAEKTESKKEDKQEEEETFSFPVSSPSNFKESPRLLWRRVPSSANSSPTSLRRLDLLRRAYQRKSFSGMETDSEKMLMMMGHDDLVKGYRDCGRYSGEVNKMDLLWEDLHELSNTKYFKDDFTDLGHSDNEPSDCRERAVSLPVKRPPEKVAILKVLKKLFYVRKNGSAK